MGCAVLVEGTCQVYTEVGGGVWLVQVCGTYRTLSADLKVEGPLKGQAAVHTADA